MSAIAGICHSGGRPADPALLQRMTDILAHRGPDGEGQWVAGPVGLGHRMLHTTPESLHEKQPLADAHGTCQLAWDGRVDNREELIAALKIDRHDQEGLTDPELVLEAYGQWGAGCVRRIVGEFAFALWDGRRRELVCARDPIGVKPFYYHWAGQRLLFGSEVKALFADPAIARRPNEAMIADYLLMGFRDPEATFFEGIKQLRPGHVLRLADSGLSIERYWDVDPSRQARYAKEEDYLEAFAALFREAVRCRLRSCSPVGLLLSGGIDSTLVTATAETLRLADVGVPELAAFTLLAEGFLQEEWDAIQHLARRYGTEVHFVRPEGADGPITLFELFLDCAETPHHDPALTIPALVGPAAARGCRVLLTGFGADELSQRAEAGYLADLLHSLQLGTLVRHARLSSTAYGGTGSGRTVLALVWDQFPPGLRRLFRAGVKRQLPRWIDAEFATRVGLDRWTMPRERRRFPTLCQETTYRALTRPAMALALNQMDGMVSAFSLECRHPYLDRRLVEFFLAVPSAVTLAPGYRKQFVQRALAAIAPVRQREEVAQFVPVMNGRLPTELEAKRLERDLFGSDGRVFRYVSRREAERLRERYVWTQGRHRNLLWNFARLEVWLRQWFPEWNSERRGKS
ncbi:MAG: asparagine synthase (glutamine-hydrolyzing) [Candidatus Rokubacteria bacterium]|nr:asparagine synthase (glutamine-hydrolyzing) [Candidatus Rokubacteria bacterium]